MFSVVYIFFIFFFFSSRRRHTRCGRDWSSDVCSSDLLIAEADDSHGFYGKKGSKTFAWRGHKFPPLIVRFIENKLVITSFLVSSFEKETHFEIGDIVTHINGEEISDIIEIGRASCRERV